MKRIFYEDEFLPDKDIILEKIGNIQRCMRRIKEVTKLKPENLDDINIQDIFVLNLQRAIQSTIDIAVHIVSSEGWGLPRNLRENFEILIEKNIVSEKLGTSLKNMIGFRNIAIHDYSRIDIKILKSILNKNLKDLEDFYSIIIKKLKI